MDGDGYWSKVNLAADRDRKERAAHQKLDRVETKYYCRSNQVSLYQAGKVNSADKHLSGTESIIVMCSLRVSSYINIDFIIRFIPPSF